jgi:hypothetical protein
MKINKKQIIDLFVERDVKRWGESERAGLVKRHQRKSIDTLLIEYRLWSAEQHGGDETEILKEYDLKSQKVTTNIDSADLGGLVGFGCLDD